jgi:TonB family protein
MSANRASTIELPRKPAGAYFHWEAGDEPVAVHFQLNIVDLLERDLISREGIGVTGVLLGRIECARKLTLVVEDYESTPNLTRGDPSDSALGERPLLEKIVERWHSTPEKRISILGFYRICAHGQVSLNDDDLEVSSIHCTERQRIFLLIEPQNAMAGRATLFMIKDGSVARQWLSVPFNRKELAEKSAVIDSLISGLPEPDPLLNKIAIREEEDSPQLPEKVLTTSSSMRWGLGIAASLVIVAVGILPLRNTELFQGLLGISKSSGEPATLGLKLQRIGSDWQISWDRTAPFINKAAAGHLTITDGLIHKNVDLDANELRSGSVIYTPITDDAALQLEIVDAKSGTLASETARMVAGKPPSRSDSTRTIGRSSDTRVRLGKLKSETSAPNLDSGKGSTTQSLPPSHAPLLLTMRPPGTVIKQEIGNPEADVTLPNPAVAFTGTYTLAPASLPPTPPEAPILSGPSLNAQPSAIPGSQIAAPKERDKDKPAQLIARKEPIYPELARKSGTAGTVELLLRVSPTGKIDSVRVVKGTPILANAAVQAVKEWRYRPAQVNGVPAESQISTSIVFMLN